MMIKLDYHETGKIFVRIDGEIVRMFSSLAEAQEYVDLLEDYEDFKREIANSSTKDDVQAYKGGFKGKLKGEVLPKLSCFLTAYMIGVDATQPQLSYGKWLIYQWLNQICGAREITNYVLRRFGLYDLTDSQLRQFSKLPKPPNLPKVKKEFEEFFRTLAFLIQLWKDAENVAASRVEQIQKEERELKKIELQLLSRTETARKALIEKRKLVDENYNHKDDWEFEGDLEEFMVSDEFRAMIDSLKV